ncbi:hypothetical protein MASR2M117_03160 [Paludibacter sp.]
MKISLFILSILLSVCVFGQEQKSGIELDFQKLKFVDQVILHSIEKKEIPGAVLCVVSREKLLYKKAYGNKQILPNYEKMTENIIFDLASMTKPIATATSIMILSERGQLRLNDPVSMYVNGFKDDITIMHLLLHISGLPSYPPVEKVKEAMTNKPDALMQYIIKNQNSKKIGKSFTYSCLNYVTLQKIVETVSGQSLRDFAKVNIFDKLDMKNTYYAPAKQKIRNIAPTEMLNDSTILRGIVHDPLARELQAGISGNAGLFSDADDLSKYSMMILNNGVYKGKRILSQNTVSFFTSIPEEYKEFGRTPGWDYSSIYSTCKGDFLSKNAISHTGYTGTSIVIDQELGISIILLTNRVHPDDKGSVNRLRALVANAVVGAVVTN